MSNPALSSLVPAPVAPPSVVIDEPCGLERRQDARLRTALLIGGGDVVAITLGLLAAFFIRFNTEVANLSIVEAADVGPLDYLRHLLCGGALLLGVLYINKMYSISTLSTSRYGALRMFSSVCQWMFLFLFITLTLQIQPPISRLFVCVSAGIVLATLTLWRYVFCRHLVARSLLESLRRNTLVIGWDTFAEKMLQESVRDDGAFHPLRIHGVLLTQAAESPELPSGVRVWNDESDLFDALRSQDIDTLLVAENSLSPAGIIRIQQICARELVDFMMTPSFIGPMTSFLHVESFHGVPLLTRTKRPLDHALGAILKRLIDLVGGAVGLITLSPVIAYFGWRVYRESPGPIFFRQERRGLNGKPFQMIKIRSMTVDADKLDKVIHHTRKHDPRMLRVGEFMRRYNIDELPQFWNVIKGEMSLVGPRPERNYYVDQLKDQIDYYNLRHTVKPGMTGWAQVNGWRGDTCLKSRIACDLEYIDRWNFWWDFNIMLRTLVPGRRAA